MLQRVLLLLLLTRFLHLIKASGAHFSRHNAGTSASGAMAYDKSAAAASWQPLSTHTNWIILQAGDATSAPKSRHALPYANSLQPTRSQTYASMQQQQQQQQQQQRLPVNYYAYNHSAGNYHQPQPYSHTPIPTNAAPKAAEPFVLAISDVRQRTSSLVPAAASASVATSPALLKRQEFVLPHVLSSSGSKLPKDDRSRSYSTKANTKAKPEVTQEIDSAKHEVAAASPAPSTATAGQDELLLAAAEQDVDVEGLNEILMPLESALDKVKRFCEIAKHLISSSNDDEIAATHSNTAAATTPTDSGDTEASSSDEVQGRAGISALSSSSPSLRRLSSSSSSSAIGTGRKIKKLKKKFKKLLLPLLIAYKLKFLTLVPVLIGGLTLLVGTTGLAGFFFALFTAVMSLKGGGGGSKAIIVKSAH